MHKLVERFLVSPLDYLARFYERWHLALVPLACFSVTVFVFQLALSRGRDIWPLSPIGFSLLLICVAYPLVAGRPIKKFLEEGELVVDETRMQFLRYGYDFLGGVLRRYHVVLTNRRLLLIKSPYRFPILGTQIWRLEGEPKPSLEVLGGLKLIVKYERAFIEFDVKDEVALAKWKAAFRVA